MIFEPEAAPSWDELAHLPGLRGVIDPRDINGAKNALIDRLHKRALRRELRGMDGRVLDFGCGTGRISEWLTQRGHEVVGVDASKDMIEVAQKNVPAATFRLSSGTSIPCEDDSVDAIISVDVLQYIVGTDSYRSIVEELGRVLKPGRRLVAIEQVGDRSVLGRAGQLDDYARSFEAARWRWLHADQLRRNDQRALVQASRHPTLARLPGLERVVPMEARLRPRPLGGDRYAEYLFVTEVPR